MCPECEALLAAAQKAAERHIAAMGRLQIATIRRETAIVEAMTIVVREAHAERERALEDFRTHSGLHRAEQSGMSA
jgi:hypothetical protein